MYVYFIKDSFGQTKIGFTRRNVDKRRKELNTPNTEVYLVYKTEVYSQLEAALKNRFKSYRIEREWFNLEEFSDDELYKTCIILDEAIKLRDNFKLDDVELF